MMANTNLRAVVATVLLGALGSSGAIASTGPNVESIFTPNLKSETTVTYDFLEQVRGPVMHETHKATIAYHIGAIKNGNVSFEGTSNGKVDRFERSADGSITLFNPKLRPGLYFFIPKQFLGAPPPQIVRGSQWTTSFNQESLLGEPGPATVRVTSIDREKGTLSVQINSTGRFEESGMFPGGNTPEQVIREADTQTNCDLSHGVIVMCQVHSRQRQTVGHMKPMEVRIDAHMTVHALSTS